MRKNCWLIFGAMLSTSLLAQQVTNPPPAAPIETPAAAPAVTNTTTLAPATSSEVSTNAPAKSGKKKKKKAEKKSAVARRSWTNELASAPLVAGPATVVASNVNVRGKATLKGEVVGRVNKGQEVTVLQEIVNNNSAADEPSAWAKILLPPSAHAWINTGYIDASAQTVKPKKLNVRSGPGENYSVIGQLEHGEAVKPLTTKGDWTEIEPPTNAYAFVAAVYLKQEAPAAGTTTNAEVAAAPTMAAPTNTTTVAEAPAVAAAPTEPPTMPSTAATESTAAAATNATEMAAANTTTNSQEIEMVTTNTPEPVVQEPPPKRIVQREGVVRGVSSIQAPTHFELFSPETGRSIDYLYTTSPLLDLRKYKGLRIVVRGEEGLDERWGNTPVITIESIHPAP